VDRVSSKVYRAISSDLGGGRNYHERGALEALREFSHEAHEFHEGVEENFSTPGNTRLMLRNLLDAQFDAEFEIEYIRVSPTLLQAFNALTVELRKLQVIYDWRWTL